MFLAQLVQFLQTAILTFNIEFLLLVGDNQTLPQLVHLHRRFDTDLPAMVLSIRSNRKSHWSTYCRDCPTSQLTLLHFGHYRHYALARSMLHPNYSDRNRIVLLAAATLENRARLMDMYSLYNLVLVEQASSGRLRAMAWCRYVDAVQNKTVSVFDGTAIWHSDDTNALMFRKRLQYWPAEPPVSGLFIGIMMAPYTFLVTDETRGGSVWLASSSLTLFQIIGDVLRFTVNVYFMARTDCSGCFEPLPMRGANRGRVMALFDYDAVVVDGFGWNSPYRALMVTQNGFAGRDNHVFEIRRYVAIVPYRTEGGSSSGNLMAANAALNAAVLLVWLAGAALFTVLRIGMRVVLGKNRDGGTIFVHCLAGVLGNSGGTDASTSRGESLVRFTIGVFAMLTSCLFTGALLEQLVAGEPVKQIETMAELAASNLTIKECWMDHDAMDRPRPNPSIGQTKHFASVGAIELDLLRHATRFAYVLPETIADIVDHPALHYANRTPVYHVVGEPYRISSQFISLIPLMMQDRVMALWARLVESGINGHIERKTTQLYKAVRSECMRRQPESRGAADETFATSEMVLLLLVLVVGHATAGLAFAIELVLTVDWRK